MIDQRMEEQASLYVLGALTEAEALEFKKAIQADAELQAFVARLSKTTDALAATVPLVEPPPQLRAKVLGRVTPAQKTLSLPQEKPRPVFWPMRLLLPGLAFLCLILLVEVGKLRETVRTQAEQISTMNQLALSLQSATNDLQHAVAALEETNRLANLRVAMLSSLAADAPKTVAVTLWDSQKQNGVFVAQNLKALPSDEDYELWVIDENQQPVAAGVFHVEANGSVRMEFKPGRLIKTAGTFAVTQEVKGGVASPTLKNMVLAGN
jgi:anti-sigma-K factor RskA